MTIYRIVITYSHPLINDVTYKSPRLFLSHPMVCAQDYEREFISHCRLLFTMDNSKYDDENLFCKIEYKTYEFHPMKDLWNRIKCYCKYHI